MNNVLFGFFSHIKTAVPLQMAKATLTFRLKPNQAMNVRSKEGELWELR